MSMILFACVAASAAAIGWASGRKARERHDQANLNKSTKAQPPPNPFVAFPCGIKDVLARSKEDELLITGGLRLSEGGSPLAAVFFGMGSPGVHRIVVVFPDREDALWLTLETTIPVGSEPPMSLSWRDTALERSRRIPVLIERFGTELPDVDREMMFAEYRGGARQSAMILKGNKNAIVAAGDLLPFTSLEHFPGS